MYIEIGKLAYHVDPMFDQPVLRILDDSRMYNEMHKEVLSSKSMRVD